MEPRAMRGTGDVVRENKQTYRLLQWNPPTKPGNSLEKFTTHTIRAIAPSMGPRKLRGMLRLTDALHLPGHDSPMDPLREETTVIGQENLTIRIHLQRSLHNGHVTRNA